MTRHSRFHADRVQREQTLLISETRIDTFLPQSPFLVSQLHTIATMDASQSTPPNAFSTNNDNITATDTVILGAGIIGLATAYHLALSLSSTTPSSPTTPLQPSILVIEPSAHICPAASGQATGGLGDFGLGPETAALGKLSFEMFQELARSGAGEKSGFSELVVYRVALKEFKGRMKPSDEWGPERPVDVEMDELPEWVRLGRECRVQRVSGAEHGAHL
jgi:glycine/D-amino acid oxidase-like deaminating enzyme